ncbi:hypothetical protein J6590_020687 [Homalodisca vitripennis]|nr:hypothetical protein J6590_020687 [Homalodisca vitripennis]
MKRQEDTPGLPINGKPVLSKIRFSTSGVQQQETYENLTIIKKISQDNAKPQSKRELYDCIPSPVCDNILLAYISGKSSSTQTEQLVRGHNIHSYNTRHTSNFHLPLHHTALFEKKSYADRKFC